jgi:deoxyribonuclease IV
MPLGAHMSTSGGIHKALERGHSIGCESIQIFGTNPTRWKCRTVDEEAISKFAKARDETGIAPIVVHARYLINLGSPDDALWAKSRNAFRDELELCEQLSLPYIVIHPGSHMKTGDEAGLSRVVDALDILREETAGSEVMILLENTAGQGTNLGYSFEHLASIMEQVHDNAWLGVCFDTCHGFAAGYELRTDEGYAETWDAFDRVIGRERLRCLHLNDSKGDFGGRRDRHQHIGQGTLGVAAFRLVMNDGRLRDLPMLLETPKGPEMEEDVENLKLLRSLMNGTGGEEE